jgi:hypothetical protein
VTFFSRCFDHRAVGCTNMNAQSSRSHAIYSIRLARTVVEVLEGKVRTQQRACWGCWGREGGGGQLHRSQHSSAGRVHGLESGSQPSDMHSSISRPRNCL